MFFLLHRQTDDSIFDNFLNISDYFLKVLQTEGHTTVAEHFPKTLNIAEDFQRLPNTFEEDSKMLQFKYLHNLRHT